MSQFEVLGVDASGRNKKIYIEADSARTARTKARSQGITPISVQSADAAAVAKDEKSLAGVLANPTGGIKSAELSDMTRQLATLIKSHVPVVESLSALVEQIEEAKLKKILMAVRQQVNEGRSLADGFAQFPKVFSNVYVNMVRAGESAGRLDVVLLRLADLSENQEKLKQRVQNALLYPVIMIVVAFLVLGIVFTKVVPAIVGIFENQKQVLPLPTRVLISLNEYFQNYFAETAIGALLILWLIERYVSTQAGRAKKDRLLLRVPVLDKLTRNLAVARFSRTMSTLLSSGVPMLTAIQITRNVVSNAVFEESLETIQTSVSEGKSLASALKASKHYPPIVIHMVGVGEKTGELEEMLGNVAETYDNQVNSTLANLTTILSPLMIVIMAGVVGFIVAGVLLPIMNMGNFQ